MTKPATPNLSYTPSTIESTGSVPYASILNSESGLVKDYFNLPPYNDEPKLFHLTAELNLTEPTRSFETTSSVDDPLGVVGGSSLDKERALGKVAGEAVERYCLLPGEVPSEYRAFNSLSSHFAMDPNSIAAGTGRVTPDRHALEIEWISGLTLKPARVCLIPSQLVFVPHIFRDDEVIIRPPISTGAASGITLEDALYRGLCEVIERDAFMVSWLRQLRLKKLIPTTNLNRNSEAVIFQLTMEASLRYQLIPEFFLLPNDVELFTVLCALKDVTGVGPAVTIGAKTSCDLSNALLGSLEEAHQMRPWMRNLLEEESTDAKPNASLPRTIRERARFWLAHEQAQYLFSWLSQCQDEIEADTLPFIRSDVSLVELVDAIQAQGATVYAVDLSSKLGMLSTSGVFMKAVKVIVPEYQPLYLTEELQDYAWQRLDSAENRLNVEALLSASQTSPVPHPFL